LSRLRLGLYADGAFIGRDLCHQAFGPFQALTSSLLRIWPSIRFKPNGKFIALDELLRTRVSRLRFVILNCGELSARMACGLNPQMEGYENGSPLSKWLSVRTPWRMVCPISPANFERGWLCNLNHLSKHLGRSKDFRDISDVELRRASFMQTVNRDRLSANSRITLTAFVEGAYLPWTKEERRASTSKGHHEIWINHIRDHVGDLHLREFAPWMPVECCARSPKKRSHKNDIATCQVGLSTIFTYAKNEGAFDGATPVDGVLSPGMPKNRERHTLMISAGPANRRPSGRDAPRAHHVARQGKRRDFGSRDSATSSSWRELRRERNG